MVSERTRDLARSTRLFRMISQCNKALVRLSDERELMRSICRIITRIGGYRMAWVGFAQNDSARTIRPVAAVGFERSYLKKASFSWANNELGRGPTGTAIRKGKVCLGKDFLTDRKLAPWRELASRRGFRSSIALPLMAGGRAFGALNIYAQSPLGFEPQQVRLLTDLTEDLSFGLMVLRQREELERRTTQLRALAGELALAEQRERGRIAAVLHDRLQQFLVGARYGVQNLRSQGNGATFENALEHVDNLLEQSIEISRNLTVELSPPVLHEAGLAAALTWLAKWFRDNHGLTVRVTDHSRSLLEREDLRITLFEAVRELLFNVVKHAKVEEAQVHLRQAKPRRVRIDVSDRGVGFDPGSLKFREGIPGAFGLLSLRERLALLGGRLEVLSTPGCGSRFTILAPLGASLRPAGRAH